MHLCTPYSKANITRLITASCTALHPKNFQRVGPPGKYRNPKLPPSNAKRLNARSRRLPLTTQKRNGNKITIQHTAQTSS